MSGSKYSMAGWLSILAAVLFPLSFILGIAQNIVGIKAFGYRGPMPGPADAIGLLFTGLTIYVIIVFRRMLHERYDFHDIDTMITLAIAWDVLFTLMALALKVFIAMAWPISETALLIIQGSFFVISMITAAIINIIIGVKIIKAEVQFTDLIKAYGYLILIAGIAQATVFLALLVLPLIPVMCILLGLILLKEKEEVDFV